MPGAVVTRRCCMVVMTLVETIAIRTTLFATTNLMRPWISACTSSDCAGAPRVSTTAPHRTGALPIASLAVATYCSACSMVRLPLRACSKTPPGSHSILKDPATARPFSKAQGLPAGDLGINSTNPTAKIWSNNPKSGSTGRSVAAVLAEQNANVSKAASYLGVDVLARSRVTIIAANTDTEVNDHSRLPDWPRYGCCGSLDRCSAASQRANQECTVCRDTDHCPATSDTVRPSAKTASTA